MAVSESLNIIIWQQTYALSTISQGIHATNCCESNVYSVTFNCRVSKPTSRAPYNLDTDTYLNKRSKVNLAHISLSQRNQHWSPEAHHFLCVSGLFILALHYLLTDEIIFFWGVDFQEVSVNMTGELNLNTTIWH